MNAENVRTSQTHLEQASFDNFAVVLALIPDLSDAQKQAVLQIIRAKSKPDEMLYLHLTQRHDRLRETLLKLGSQRLAGCASGEGMLPHLPDVMSAERKPGHIMIGQATSVSDGHMGLFLQTLAPLQLGELSVGPIAHFISIAQASNLSPGLAA